MNAASGDGDLKRRKRTRTTATTKILASLLAMRPRRSLVLVIIANRPGIGQ